MFLNRALLASACIAWLLIVPAFAAVTFDAVLANENLWTLDQNGFEKLTGTMPFEWTSNARDSARAARAGMTLFGLPLTEVVVHFDAGTLSQITLNIYARGDAGHISEEKYKALVLQSVEAVTKGTGVKHTVRGRDAKNAVKAEGLVWQTPKSVYTLEYSSTKEVKSRDIPFRAEFVRIEVSARPKDTGFVAVASNTSHSKFNGATHVKKDAASGDVMLEGVPMVDQGQKGYCVVASAERVMRYYGTDVDANELAQIANSDAQGGTSLDAMRDSLKKVGSRLKVRIREVEKFEVKELLELLKDYNRAARKLEADAIPDPGHFIDVPVMYGQMKAEVLKEARTKNKSDLTRFQRDIQLLIDQGIPPLWSVQLGFVQEPGIRQAGGGHMRLIVGYNPKTQEILYSDSWGAGHELKRMKADDAWTITTGLLAIEPLG